MTAAQSTLSSGVFWCLLYDFRFGLCFFFQAEDGIRYLVRSRGLGDVYKRHSLSYLSAASMATDSAEDAITGGSGITQPAGRSEAGSYTHLTLPTSDLA